VSVLLDDTWLTVVFVILKYHSWHTEPSDNQFWTDHNTWGGTSIFSGGEDGSTFAPNHYNLGHTYVSTILKTSPRRQKVALPLDSANKLYFTYIFILLLFAELKQAIHPNDPSSISCIRNRLFATSPDVDREYWKTDYLIKKYTENWSAGVRLSFLKSGICFAIYGRRGMRHQL